MDHPKTDVQTVDKYLAPNNPQGKTLNELLKQRKYNLLFFLSLFVVGLFNNNGYVMVGSASSDLSIQFGKENLMPMFQLSLILFSSLTRFVNSIL